ncbi:putative zinc transporter cis4-like protein [Elsinoe fawcettii]|nr:putative zinc transporter cis4-like protein [Elsinoe fawcettii]
MADFESVSSITQTILTGAIVPLQYLLAHALHGDHSRYETAKDELDAAIENDRHDGVAQSPMVKTAALVAATLVASGILVRIRSSPTSLDRRKKSDPNVQASGASMFSSARIQCLLKSALGIALPIYASMLLGGARVAIITVTAIASGLSSSTARFAPLPEVLQKSAGFLLAFAGSVVLDFSHITSAQDWHNLAFGYLTLATSVVAIRPPFVENASLQFKTTGMSKASGSKVPNEIAKLPDFLSTRQSSDLSTLTGIVIGLAAYSVCLVAGSMPEVSESAIIALLCATFSSTLANLFCNSAPIQSRPAVGLITSALVLSLITSFGDSMSWTARTANIGIVLASSAASAYDSLSASPRSALDNTSVHTGHGHHHGKVSVLTAFLLSRVRRGSLIYDILSEKDSRRIAYFTCLNFAFMLVQGFYGWVSGSLGLLSDTVHMFFDCLALIIGLAASVASKWPTSPEKPYGWGKLNTLAGFGNGVFLMLVSVEFVWGAIEGIMEGTELRRVEELLVVTTTGTLMGMVTATLMLITIILTLMVTTTIRIPTLITIILILILTRTRIRMLHPTPTITRMRNTTMLAAIRTLTSITTHILISNLMITTARTRTRIATTTLAHIRMPIIAMIILTRTPIHYLALNENMHGIYLHIAADAGGSLAVIISTTLTLWKPWYLWDPLATILIAILIFMAAVPLVMQSAKKLLLVIPEDLEYELKNALQDLVSLRGVTGVGGVRFWVEDGESDGGHGHHHHGHSHGEDEGKMKLIGNIHVFASRAAGQEDVRERVNHFFRDRGMEVLVQVEREGEGGCWCGGGAGEKNS